MPAPSHPYPIGTMSLTKDQIKATLAETPAPGLSGSLGDHLEWTTTCDGVVSTKFHLKHAATPAQFDAIAHATDRSLRTLAAGEGEPLTSLLVEFVDAQGTTLHRRSFNTLSPTPEPTNTAPRPASHPPQPSQPADASPGHRPIPGLAAPGGALAGVRHIIAVGAGKGGVGKSAIAVNAAVGLARRGHAVGILDADIYGPSLPTMLGLQSLEQSVVQGRLQPFAVHGIKAITLGKMVDPEKPLIWRGPMAHGAFKQLTDQTSWGELDYLIIDLPPGTGDIALTMTQTLSLAGAVIVCTPQQVAQDDAIRAVRMFQQLNVEILGVVENMSYFIGDDGKTYDLFGRGGAELMAQRLGLPFLGAIPITTALRVNSDSGEPRKNFDPQASGERLPKALDALAANIESQAALASMRKGQTRPSLTIS
jgi:ATP-binding protein involved in chromosome partitioning